MNVWLEEPKDLAEFKTWCLAALKELKRFVKDVHHDWYDPIEVAESSAALVESAGLIALDLGLPDLYALCSRASYMTSPDDAVVCLGRCLAACESPKASQQRPVKDAPLMVDAKGAAALCGISPASWYRYRSAGKTPAPVKLGGCVLYRVEDLKKWISQGCPE